MRPKPSALLLLVLYAMAWRLSGETASLGDLQSLLAFAPKWMVAAIAISVFLTWDSKGPKLRLTRRIAGFSLGVLSVLYAGGLRLPEAAGVMPLQYVAPLWLAVFFPLFVFGPVSGRFWLLLAEFFLGAGLVFLVLYSKGFKTIRQRYQKDPKSWPFGRKTGSRKSSKAAPPKAAENGQEGQEDFSEPEPAPKPRTPRSPKAPKSPKPKDGESKESLASKDKEAPEPKAKESKPRAPKAKGSEEPKPEKPEEADKPKKPKTPKAEKPNKPKEPKAGASGDPEEPRAML
jgi:hypothetical protein